MPVYDYTYQTWEGKRRGPMARWLTIPKYTYKEFFSKRVFIWLFTMAWLQFIMRMGYIYLLVNMEFLTSLNIHMRLAPLDAYFFKNMIDIQLFFCILFAFMIGSSLISRDTAHNAVVLYMSKPISKWEYLAGKFLTLFSLFMVMTWFQVGLLFIVQTAVAPDHSAWRLYFWTDYAWIFGAITFYSVVLSAMISLMILAASSLTKNARYAGMTFVVYIIGSSIIGGVVSGILHNVQLLAISPVYSGVELGFYLFRIGEGRQLMKPGMAWLGVLGVCGLAGVILKWRISRAARYGR